MSTSDGKVRINKFNGTKEHWPVWSLQNKAKARQEGYLGEMIGTVPIPPDSEVIDESTDAGKQKMLSRKNNAKGFQDLILLVDGTKPEG